MEETYIVPVIATTANKPSGLSGVTFAR